MRYMKRELILTALTAAVIAALVLLPRHTQEPIEGGEQARMVAPGLRKQLNTIDEIRITRNEESVTLYETESGQWRIDELYGYPASKSDIRKFLLFIAQSEIRAEKTADPERLERLKLDETQAHQVYIKQDGELLHHIVLGKLSDTPISTYVRLGKTVQSYLASGHLDFSATPYDWLDNDLLSVNRQRVRRIAYDFDGRKPYRFERSHPDEEMQLKPLPADKQLKHPNRPFDASNFFERLKFVKVLTDEHIVTEGKNKVVMETFDGLEVTLRFHPIGFELWADISARVVPEKRLPEASGVTLTPLKAVKAEAQAINAQLEGWLYVLGQFQQNQLTRSYYDVVELK